MMSRVMSRSASRVLVSSLMGARRGYKNMDIVEYLLKVEKDGEEYYRNLAKNAPNKGFKRIFDMLADEEARHYKAIEEIQFGSSTMSKGSTILAETRTIFEQLEHDKLGGEVDLLASGDQMALYAGAREIERRNRDEYVKRAQEATDPKLKALFQLVAAEEQKHFIMLDELIQFIGKAEPGSGRWTECAEYSRLDDKLYESY